MTTTINFPIPSVLPAVKGLFKKNDIYAGNGWANVKRDFLNDKILAKLHNAGYECITSKTEHGDSGDNYYSLYANLTSGDVVTLSAINYAEAYDNKGRERGFSTFGNVDLYRGEPMKRVLNYLGYGIEDGFLLTKEAIENKKKEQEAKSKQIDFRSYFEKIFTPKERQALKDAYRYGFWGDTENEFSTSEAQCAVCCTNDIKKGGHFSGKEVSGLISSIAKKFRKNDNGLLDFHSDYWEDGNGDVVMFNLALVSDKRWSAWAREEENDFKVDSKASNSDNDKIIVKEEKPSENAYNDVKNEFSEEIEDLDSILRKKLSKKEIQIVKNELLRLRNNYGVALLN